MDVNMSKQQPVPNLKEAFDISGFDLTNFEYDEISYLQKHGNFLEALSLGRIRPKTIAQRNFVDFIEPKLENSRGWYTRKQIWPNTIEMLVWEKILLGDEYYLKIQKEPEKLAMRNYFAYYHTKFFNINKFTSNLVVYLKSDGNSKPGGDEFLRVKYAFMFEKKNNDKYIHSLFKHDKIGETIYTESQCASYSKSGDEFREREEGILLQIDCKKIEVEMKISAIKNYSVEDHKKSLHLDGYVFNVKTI